MILEPAVRVEHGGVAEVAWFDRQVEGGKGPVGDWHLFDLGGDDFEDAGLEDEIGIGGVGPGDELAGAFEVGEEIGLAAPQAEAASDELGAGGGEHAEVVVEVAAAIEHAFHGDRAGEVMLECGSGDRAIELIRGGDGTGWALGGVEGGGGQTGASDQGQDREGVKPAWRAGEGEAPGS